MCCPHCCILHRNGPVSLNSFFFSCLARVQLGLPYFLIARGLRVVSAQEAGAITLLEPLLNPLWAYLVAPEVEQPRLYTIVGGSFILGGLLWRYWPRKKAAQNRGKHWGLSSLEYRL